MAGPGSKPLSASTSVTTQASPRIEICYYGRGVRRPGVSNVDPTRVVALGAIVAIVGTQMIFFGLPFGLWLHGLTLGGTTR